MINALRRLWHWVILGVGGIVMLFWTAILISVFVAIALDILT